jgi:hypothetical protein
MSFLVHQGQVRPPQDEGGRVLAGGVVREFESRFMIDMKRHGVPAGFRCNFRTYVDGEVWGKGETTDFGRSADKPGWGERITRGVSGEDGIRTRDGVLPPYRFSKPALSATQPPLRSCQANARWINCPESADYGSASGGLARCFWRAGIPSALTVRRRRGRVLARHFDGTP